MNRFFIACFLLLFINLKDSWNLVSTATVFNKDRELDLNLEFESLNGPDAQFLACNEKSATLTGISTVQQNFEQCPESDFNSEEIWRNYETSFFFCDMEKLIEYIESDKFDPNAIVLGNRTPLILAISKGDLELVKILIKVPEIDVNLQGNLGIPPIELALSNFKIFETLVMEAPGLDPLAPNIFQVNPIKRAIDDEKFWMAACMLERVNKDCDLEAGDGERLELSRLLENEMMSKYRLQYSFQINFNSLFAYYLSIQDQY